MSGMINPADCPVCNNHDAAIICDDGEEAVVTCSRCGYKGEPGEFDHDDYEWISPKDLCPEEDGMVLVDFDGGPNGDNGDDDYGLAVYTADEEGDYWTVVNQDGSAGPTIDPPSAWAELPKGCHTFPPAWKA